MWSPVCIRTCPGAGTEVYLCMLAYMWIRMWLGAGIGVYLCTFAHMCTRTGTGVCSRVHSVKSHCTLFSAYCTLHFAGTFMDACICALVRMPLYVYTLRRGCCACVYMYGESPHVYG